MKKTIVSFKGSRNGLQVICDEGALWSDVIDQLRSKITGKERDFFDGASVIVDTGLRNLTSDQVSLLWETFQESGIKIKTIQTKNKPDKLQLKDDTELLEEKVIINNLPTLWVRKNIRSGQKISFAGNVIIIGDVNPGAEIVVAGFVIVFGWLRGTVHAGATGDENAWVIAHGLQPTQLRIANYITCAPDEEPQVPEIARICDGMIICEELKKNTITI